MSDLHKGERLSIRGRGAPNSRATGVIVADQVKSADWVARGAVRMGRVKAATVQEVTDLIATLLDLLTAV